eukprot:9949275-Alexandrium_andersonii.AAC.1
MPDQHSPFAGSLLRALINKPTEVPACKLSGLQPFPQPPGAKLLDGDLAEDLQPSGRCGRSPL